MESGVDEEQLTLDQYLLQLAREGDVEELQKWVHSADPFFVGPAGQNTFHYAAANAHLSIMDVLHSTWCDKLGPGFFKILNQQTQDGNTPLHYSLFSKKVQVVEWLLEKGADSSVRNKGGKTVLEEAVQMELEEIAERIAERQKVTAEELEQLEREGSKIEEAQEEEEEDKKQ